MSLKLDNSDHPIIQFQIHSKVHIEGVNFLTNNWKAWMNLSCNFLPFSGAVKHVLLWETGLMWEY